MANVCIIEGCTTEVSVTVHTSICHDHWRAIPIELRKRWWKETGFGRRDPSLELIARINKTLFNSSLVVAVDSVGQQVDYEKIGREIPVVTTRDPNFPNYVEPKPLPPTGRGFSRGGLVSPKADEIGKQQAGAPSPIDGKR